MWFKRTSRLIFALLLLLLAAALPLRSYAGIANCDASHHSHCAQSGGALHSHSCGDCCAVAADALTPARHALPHAPAVVVPAPMIWPPPALTLDRLDRPPRLPA
jgi:hypothetical protein